MALKQKLTDNQRIEFMKQIEYFYDISHPSWRRLMTFSFLKGLATGLGVFVGGTIVVGLLAWILNGLGHIPLLQDITDPVQNTLEQGN